MNLLILKVRSEVKFLNSTFSYLVGGNKNVYNFCVSFGTADNEHILSESRHYLKKLWLVLHILIYWYIDPQTTCYNAMILMLHLYVSHLKNKKKTKKNFKKKSTEAPKKVWDYTESTNWRRSQTNIRVKSGQRSVLVHSRLFTAARNLTQTTQSENEAWGWEVTPVELNRDVLSPRRGGLLQCPTKQSTAMTLVQGQLGCTGGKSWWHRRVAGKKAVSFTAGQSPDM